MGCTEDMKYVKESLLSKLKEHCCDPYVDTKELGEVADIVKDMCEAEYYCSVTEAMKNAVVDPDLDIYGYAPTKPVYNRNMYGYRPYMEQDYAPTVGNRMGYNPENVENNPRYGKAYNEYERSRKHYTKTKDENDKKDMNKHMDEHVRDVVATVRQMWAEADPAQRVHLKTDIQSLLDGMKE